METFDFYLSIGKMPSYNMALDEFLFNKSKLNHSKILHLYTWSRPTITIGKMQNINDILTSKCIKNGIIVIRRLTGGRAVFHLEELTYSMIIPLSYFKISNPNSFESKRNIFTYTANLIINSLSPLGINGSITQSKKGILRNPNCFASTSIFEIVNDKGIKVVGSSMLIRDDVALVQGSIPLTNSYKDITYFIKNTPNTNKSYNNLYCKVGPMDNRLHAFLKSLNNYMRLEYKDCFDYNDIASIERIMYTKYNFAS